jgi:hypothetical protein
MNLRAALFLLITVLTLSWLSYKRLGPSAVQPSPKPRVSIAQEGGARFRPSATSHKSAKNEAAFDEERAKRDEDVTTRNMIRAVEAAKLDTSDFGNNGPFLHEKYKSLFDGWDLVEEQRDKFIAVLVNEGLEMTRTSIKSKIAWPSEVGDARKHAANSAHMERLNANYAKIRNNTFRELAELVGEERAREYQRIAVSPTLLKSLNEPSKK